MLAPGSRLIIHIPVICSDLNILRSVFTFVEVDFFKIVFRHKFASYTQNVRLYCLYAQLEFDMGQKISAKLSSTATWVPQPVL